MRLCDKTTTTEPPPAGSLEGGGGVGSQTCVCAGSLWVNRPAVMVTVVMATLLIAYHLQGLAQVYQLRG